MADLIKQSELKDRMKKIPEWELEKNQIERTFEFDDFVDAIDFVDRVAEVAEEEEHHPDIDIRYNKVRLVLSTHSKGGFRIGSSRFIWDLSIGTWNFPVTGAALRPRR